jgi:hypothetical protein
MNQHLVFNENIKSFDLNNSLFIISYKKAKPIHSRVNKIVASMQCMFKKKNIKIRTK